MSGARFSISPIIVSLPFTDSRYLSLLLGVRERFSWVMGVLYCG